MWKGEEKLKREKLWVLVGFNEMGKVFPSPSCSSVEGATSFTGASHNSEDVEENIDDVSVEVEGSKYVFLWTQSQLLVAQKELGINSQETGEEQGAQGGIDNMQNPVADEDAEDGEQQQDDETHEEHSPAGSEVILAL